MKSRHGGRHDRRPQPRPLEPEERAGLHRAALAYRAALRAEAAGTGKDSLAAPVADAEPDADGEADRRARFAAAVARAEFGRFYWKDGGPVRGKTRRNKRARSNGARPG